MIGIMSKEWLKGGIWEWVREVLTGDIYCTLESMQGFVGNEQVI
jgi:hypothetical protein